MNWRYRVANCFGSHSRRVWRCIVGATWSLPLRYVTLSAQLMAMGVVPGVFLRIPLDVMFIALSTGVAVGWVIRIVDNLVNEYVVFAAVVRHFKGRTDEGHRQEGCH